MRIRINTLDENVDITPKDMTEGPDAVAQKITRVIATRYAKAQCAKIDDLSRLAGISDNWYDSHLDSISELVKNFWPVRK